LPAKKPEFIPKVLRDLEQRFYQMPVEELMNEMKYISLKYGNRRLNNELKEGDQP
jgi:hypothetical protein